MSKPGVPAFILGTCLLFFLFSLTTRGQQPSGAELKKKAIELTSRQKFTEALPMLERLVIEMPEDAEVHFQLGFALMGKAATINDEAEKRKLIASARKAFIKAKELGSEEPVLDALIGGLPPEGTVVAENPISQNAEAARLMKEGEAAFAQGKLDDALKNYEKALRLDPRLYEAALFAGDVNTTRGKFKEAEEWYQKAITIDPGRETAYRYSATPLMKQKKYAEARDRYIEAYITEPYNRFATAGLTQWAEVTGASLGHPEIEIPKAAHDKDGEFDVELLPKHLLGDKKDGLFAWRSYGPARNAWRKQKFAIAFPQEASYRHSLSEEADALRSVLAAARAEPAVTQLDPSLARLKKLDEEGLLEAFILLALADDGISLDHPAYLKAGREKLRHYVIQYVISESSSQRSDEKRDRGEARKSGSVVERTYDRSKDETSIKIGLMPITCVSDGCVFFSLDASFAGTKPPAEIDRFLFGIAIFTKTLRPWKDPAMLARVDGIVTDLGPMEFVGEESKDGLKVVIYGSVLDYRSLEKLARGKSVELKLGTLQFQMAERNIRAISELFDEVRSGR